jgi:hypothetical protein
VKGFSSRPTREIRETRALPEEKAVVNMKTTLAGATHGSAEQRPDACQPPARGNEMLRNTIWFPQVPIIAVHSTPANLIMFKNVKDYVYVSWSSCANRYSTCYKWLLYLYIYKCVFDRQLTRYHRQWRFGNDSTVVVQEQIRDVWERFHRTFPRSREGQPLGSLLIAAIIDVCLSLGSERV